MFGLFLLLNIGFTSDKSNPDLDSATQSDPQGCDPKFRAEQLVGM